MQMVQLHESREIQGVLGLHSYNAEPPPLQSPSVTRVQLEKLQKRARELRCQDDGETRFF